MLRILHRAGNPNWRHDSCKRESGGIIVSRLLLLYQFLSRVRDVLVRVRVQVTCVHVVFILF